MRNNAKCEPATINAERNEKWNPDVSIVAARDAEVETGDATEAKEQPPTKNRADD